MRAFLLTTMMVVLTGLAVAQGQNGGIGLVFDGDAGGNRVTSVVPGGPGDRAGVRAGDVIVAVDGRPLAGLDAEMVAALIRGPIGSPVKLALAAPDGRARTVTIVRGVLPRQEGVAPAQAPAVPNGVQPVSRTLSAAPAPATQRPTVGGVTFVPWVEPRERSFSVDVPRGWRVDGGLNWTGPLDPQMFIRAQSPDGRVQIFVGDPEILPRQAPGPMTSLQTGGTAEGGVFRMPSGGPAMVQRFLSGVEFGKYHVAQRICQAPRWLREADLPDLSRSATAALMPDAQRAGVVARASAGDAGFACGDALGYVTATTVLAERPGTPLQLWGVLRVGGFTASDSRRAIEARYIAEHMMATMKSDPRWTQAWERRVVQVTGGILSMQNAMTQSHLQAARNAASVQARLNNPNPGVGRRSSPRLADTRDTRRVCDAIDRCQTVSTEHETVFMDHSGRVAPGRAGGAPPDNTGVWAEMK